MSHSTSLIPLGQVAGTRQQLLAQGGGPFAEHFPAAFVHRTFRTPGHVFRQRLFSPAVTLWTFLSQVFDPDHSCRAAVARLLAWRLASGLPPCSPDTAAYCRARQRLPEAGLAALTRHSGRAALAKAPPSWLWKGRPVKVVDGTGLSMPDTPANQKAYPQLGHLPAGVGFPLLRLVVVFSLTAGTVLDAALSRWRGKGTGEVSLFRALADVLQPGDVLLADRLYAGYWQIARALACGADVVLRWPAGRAAPLFRGRGRSTAHAPVCWLKPQRPSWMRAAEYARVPAQLWLRAVRVDVRRPGFRTRRLVLVTTLRDAAAVTRDELADLYRRRWQAEWNLRSLKQTLQMDILRGQTPEVVRKEVWAHLLVYNVIRTVMAEAAARATVAALLGLVLLEAIGRHRVGNRPNRYEPRAVKRRPKKYPRLKVPRAEARRRLRTGAKRVGRKR